MPNPTKNHLAPRPLRLCRSSSPAFSSRVSLLTAEQQNLIRKSWQKMSKPSIGKTIYANMNAKCSDMPKFFELNDGVVERHQRYFVELIQSAIDNLGDIDGALRPWLENISRAHTGFAIKSKHWDAFVEATLSSISEWIGPSRNHRETVRSWTILCSYISDRLSSAATSSASPVFTPRLQLLTLVSTPTTPV